MNVMVTERLGKAGGKISFLCLSNLSAPSLKTKESIAMTQCPGPFHRSLDILPLHRHSTFLKIEHFPG